MYAFGKTKSPLTMELESSVVLSNRLTSALRSSVTLGFGEEAILVQIEDGIDFEERSFPKNQLSAARSWYKASLRELRARYK